MAIFFFLLSSSLSDKLGKSNCFIECDQYLVKFGSSFSCKLSECPDKEKAGMRLGATTGGVPSEITVNKAEGKIIVSTEPDVESINSSNYGRTGINYAAGSFSRIKVFSKPAAFNDVTVLVYTTAMERLLGAEWLAKINRSNQDSAEDRVHTILSQHRLRPFYTLFGGDGSHGRVNRAVKTVLTLGLNHVVGEKRLLTTDHALVLVSPFGGKHTLVINTRNSPGQEDNDYLVYKLDKEQCFKDLSSGADFSGLAATPEPDDEGVISYEGDGVHRQEITAENSDYCVVVRCQDNQEITNDDKACILDISAQFIDRRVFKGSDVQKALSDLQVHGPFVYYVVGGVLAGVLILVVLKVIAANKS